ncbi:unnamed protein product [Medioppia subpectinata]|uniref:G-protein coupled receptors family 1 profile domain-containing protein n=1 Tax=Medioppia subpectinata TaxID=1979941 RepID=A0A7R9PZC5_9ACAR|nr:unnamed protein product [Medioppia subpectinata]CAG2106034.1 unnamed protein product [Medioppia subpectinata]
MFINKCLDMLAIGSPTCRPKIGTNTRVIFDCPVTTTCCLQTFCEDCINDWLQKNTTCPYDRKSLTKADLTRASRIIVNTLGRFKIRCDYWDLGCREVIKLEALPHHTLNCRYKDTKCLKCQCVQQSGHDCIDTLRAEIEALKITKNDKADNSCSTSGCSSNDQSLDWTVYKARFKHNKICRILNRRRYCERDMNEPMVSVLTDIVFEVMGRYDSMRDTAAAIEIRMSTKYPGRKWQCSLDDKSVTIFDYSGYSKRGTYFDGYVDQLGNVLPLISRYVCSVPSLCMRCPVDPNADQNCPVDANLTLNSNMKLKIFYLEYFSTIITTHKLQIRSNYLILSLSITDLMVGALSMPVFAYHEVVHLNDWLMGYAMCHIHNFVTYVLSIASFLHIFFIAIDRYLSVSRVDYSRNRSLRPVWVMIAISWTLAVAKGMGRSIGHMGSDMIYVESMDAHLCLWSDDPDHWAIGTVIIAMILFVIIYSLYYKIYQKSREFRYKTETNVNRSTAGIQQQKSTDRALSREFQVAIRSIIITLN